MDACWGFDLDMSAVRLMRREDGHWRQVALERIDGPDIEDRLMAMVDRVEPGAAVELFLPREQILYTDVRITSRASAPGEIAAAMDGRTPYTLDDLEIDWALTAPGTARVAAIARETLDEAADFARVRGLAVAGFSSLVSPEDFPRLPAFGDFTALPDADADLTNESKSAVAFASVREPRAADLPTPPSPSPTSEGPVVRVDDATPVMQVKSRIAPLDPGRPLDTAFSPPRVRTDIAAGSLSGVAASLMPAGSTGRIRSGTGTGRTLAIFVVAAALTIGIAVIVWSILPLSPGKNDTETGQSTDIDAAPVTVAAADPQPDLPQPEVGLDAGALADAPAADSAPVPPSPEAISGDRARAPQLAGVAPDGIPPPQAQTPLERSPDTLASALTEDPVQGLDGTEDAIETTLDIYLASIERRDLAFDAIALPDVTELAVADLPSIAPPPAAIGETVDLASLAPSGTLPEAEDPPQRPTAVATGTAPGAVLPASGLRPTALAAALPDRAPRARPADLTLNAERQTFGGKTRTELAQVTPKPRPQSAQAVARPDPQPVAEASALAVASSIVPRTRPQDFDALVAAAIVGARTVETTASVAYDVPDTSAAIEAALADDAEPEPTPQDTPRLAIPSGASVSRQATIENAIPLNKINLVGVYGVPSDRRALLRLPSGRYVKVKVGDRVDGGTVAQINDSELIYRKGSRTVSLAMPKG